ncbi:hypothetical protein BV22DRAFT_1021328 [Leucogyrophana mollusca]|uniref:Uncharacterized protein n=1 Tax=Leucogyrophana mollusca TaxID=85980 RepID=A0ACB8B578_9AGAM|nr:hypothetical protein BV22DRAFT_1021328 [Leucogyrophana mollusca]
MDDDGANSRHAQTHSLAHELAVALMPEPSAGSKLLAEEFGIEYDEGAEGIDEDGQEMGSELSGTLANEFGREASEANQLNGEMFAQDIHDSSDEDNDEDTMFGSSSFTSRLAHARPEQDAMEILAQNLASTDKFLSHLRQLDSDAGSGSTTTQPQLERSALDILRRMNETTRDREGQVRELLECEREFRKIASEVGGTEVLGQLDELPEDNPDDTPRSVSQRLSSVAEEQVADSSSGSWERQGVEDDGDMCSETGSPVKTSFPPHPPINGPLTPATAIPQLAHIRTLTTSLVASLTSISEQAQVDGAATTDAGRKLRALKNRLGGWQTEWDSAEASRVKIERWEAGMWEEKSSDGNRTPSTSPKWRRWEDGRKVAEEQLKAFEKAVAEAGLKAQTIMAR